VPPSDWLTYLFRCRSTTCIALARRVSNLPLFALPNRIVLLQSETGTFIYIVIIFDRNHPAKGVLDDPELPTVVFTTVCTKSRRPCLANPQTHAALQTAWRKCAAWLVGPYVIMPDHLHVFAAPSEFHMDFDRWISRWKAHVTHQLRSPYRLWQNGSFHHRIRGFESAEAKREYMLNNPVRAGLVSNWDEWPYRGELFPSERWW
jgi:putative transposase